MFAFVFGRIYHFKNPFGESSQGIWCLVLISCDAAKTIFLGFTVFLCLVGGASKAPIPVHFQTNPFLAARSVGCQIQRKVNHRLVC